MRWYMHTEDGADAVDEFIEGVIRLASHTDDLARINDQLQFGFRALVALGYTEVQDTVVVGAIVEALTEAGLRL